MRKSLYSSLMKKVKALVEVVLERELQDEEFRELVIQRGLESIIEDFLPPDEETLRAGFLAMFREHPDAVLSFLKNTIEKIKESEKEKIKRRIGFEVE